MTRRTMFLTAGGAIVLAVGWYLFRPELLFVNKTVNEAFPAAVRPAGMSDSGVLLTGSFSGVAHETKGTASIHRLGDGTRVLRLTGFETSNGPDVRVLLVAAPAAADNDAVRNAKYVELGSLKGNVGDQNYDVPANVDLQTHRSVVIWCNRFGVNFGSASLSEDGAGSAPRTAVLRSGTFHGVAHETNGMAAIHQLEDGMRVLRLMGFETSNGPDVRVLLIAAQDAHDNDAVRNGGYIELGALKGNVGDQNYEIPDDVDLSRYHAVTIWCNRFGVNFGTAPLSRG